MDNHPRAKAIVRELESIEAAVLARVREDASAAAAYMTIASLTTRAIEIEMSVLFFTDEIIQTLETFLAQAKSAASSVNAT